MRRASHKRAATLFTVVLLVAGLSAIALTAAAQSAFPGTNGKIAFTSNRDGNDEIYTMNANGTGQTRRTNHAASDGQPAWSPDGSRIAFRSDRDGNFEIYTMNADGTGQTRRTTNAMSDSAPSWSPDGTKIAFSTNRDGNFEIYTMNADGTNQIRRTNDAANDTGPAWSPDGTKIAFVAERNGNQEIYTMDPDGSGQLNRTNNGASDLAANWSPDATKLTFRSDRDGNLEIYTMNANGSGQLRRTTDASGDAEPVWSPDNALIAFQTNRDVNLEIYSMNVDGSGTTRLTNNTTNDSAPDWQSLSYQHPASTVPTVFQLVPLMRQTTSDSVCTARGGTPSDHQAPQAVDSCGPPVPTEGTSAYFGSDGVGSATLAPLVGDPISLVDQADYVISLNLTDVRAGGIEGGDYFPDMTMAARLRITDKRSCAPPGCTGPYYRPATTADFDISVPLSCVDTVPVAIGATCSVNTSADAVTAGAAIKESRQTVINLFRIRVIDAGVDLITGNADDKLFAMEGAFIP
jgi:Tol biopolymer transport system component